MRPPIRIDGRCSVCHRVTGDRALHAVPSRRCTGVQAECEAYHRRETFVQAAHATYESIGQDLWGGEFQGDDDEFVDCILDHIHILGGLTREQLAEFDALPQAERRAIVLEAQ